MPSGIESTRVATCIASTGSARLNSMQHRLRSRHDIQLDTQAQSMHFWPDMVPKNVTIKTILVSQFGMRTRVSSPYDFGLLPANLCYCNMEATNLLVYIPSLALALGATPERWLCLRLSANADQDTQAHRRMRKIQA